jgi:alpha-1,3-glucan synthase
MGFRLWLLFLAVCHVRTLRFDPAEEEHNLNQNQHAVLPLDYWGQWE